jgi:uncharacterized protein YbjT (DUF2867 family)
MTLLVVGATGSIVADEAIRKGQAVRVLVRDCAKAAQLPPKAQVIIGDVTRPTRFSSQRTV